jgi:hypothetical protein
MTDQQLVPVEADAQSILTLVRQARQATDLTIRSDADYEAAGNKLREIKKWLSAVEDRRKSWTAPLRAVIKSMDGFFKPVETEVETLLEDLKASMLAYKQKIEAERQAALQEAAKLAAAGAATGTTSNVAAFQALVAAGSASAPVAAGISYRDNWKWRIVDFSKIPQEYLTLVVNSDKVNEAVKQGKEKASIPGIEIYNEKITVVR